MRILSLSLFLTISLTACANHRQAVRFKTVDALPVVISGLGALTKIENLNFESSEVLTYSNGSGTYIKIVSIAQLSANAALDFWRSQAKDLEKFLEKQSASSYSVTEDQGSCTNPAAVRGLISEGTSYWERHFDLFASRNFSLKACPNHYWARVSWLYCKQSQRLLEIRLFTLQAEQRREMILACNE